MSREGLATVSPHEETTELLLLDGRSLTLETVERAARRRLTVELACDRQTTAQLRASLELKERLVAEGLPIYGVTTGFGDSAHRQISPAKAEALQRSLVRMLGCGTGAF